MHHGILFQQPHISKSIGIFDYPPKRIVFAQTAPFSYPIHGNQNQGREVVKVIQNGTLGQTYKSAPTSYREFVVYENIIPSRCACRPYHFGE